MHQVHLVGSPSPLFDNLVITWHERFASFEHSPLDNLATALRQIHQQRPRCVVYCGHAAVSGWDFRANSKDDVAPIELLIDAVLAVGARLVFISSDRVFAGPKMFHEESDLVEEGPDDQLRSIEQSLLHRLPAENRPIVIRTHTFGWSEAGVSFAERLWNSLELCEPVDLDPFSFATPILASHLAELIPRCVQSKLDGTVHIAGAERTSPFRFAQELAAAAGFDRRLVRPSTMESQSEQRQVALRETSLACRRVRRELAMSLPLLRESIAAFVRQAESEYRDRIRRKGASALVDAA
jgi:dTDP-4-dehydrorhamnose reductase